MNSVNAEFIERYQLLYQKDPNSKVFAPLAEAYRKLGLLDEAFRVCEQGVQRHPNFPSGRVAFAKILIEKKQFEEAIVQLKAAVDISPENILAHVLLGESYMQIRQMKEALKSYKMVLFLNPNDQKAQVTVKKLESLTADEYEDEIFQMKKLQDLNDSTELEEFEVLPQAPPDSLAQNRILERHLSLADAYIVRNDGDNALATLEQARNQIGSHPEIEKRRKILIARQQAALTTVPQVVPEVVRKQDRIRKKVDRLQKLRQRLADRRHLIES